MRLNSLHGNQQTTEAKYSSFICLSNFLSITEFKGSESQCIGYAICTILAGGLWLVVLFRGQVKFCTITWSRGQGKEQTGGYFLRPKFLNKWAPLAFRKS